MSDNPYQPAAGIDAARLRALGQPLVDALEAYRRSHGVFPASLEAGGLEPVQTPAGVFEYRLTANGRRASLSIGDYAQRQFRVRWSSEIGWFVGD